MKIIRKNIKTVIIAGVVAALVIVSGTPAISQIPQNYNQVSNQIFNGSPNAFLPGFLSGFSQYSTISSSSHSHSADSAFAPSGSYGFLRGNIFGQKVSVRKNVVDLTPQEKKAFVNAVRTLKNTIPKGSNISIYDQFVAVHVGAMGLMYNDAQGPAAGHDGAHESALLLPWHRELIYRFEKALQSVDSKVTLPYWDWTDSKALEVIFNDDFMGPNGQGVTLNIPADLSNVQGGPDGQSGNPNIPDSANVQGGSDGQSINPNIPDSGNVQGGPDMSGSDGQSGNPNIPLITVKGGPVQSGPFSAASGWFANPDLHFKPSGESFGKQILRFLQVPPTNNYPLPKEDIEQILAIDDYETFRPALEGFIKIDSATKQPTNGVFLHNYFHSFVGGATFDPAVGRPSPLGTMADLATSINDPVFWLIHANVDRLWAEWQNAGHAGSNYYPAAGGHYGENLNDRLWPWDGGESTPANWGPGDLLSLLPRFSSADIVTPADTLNFRKYGYIYK